MSGLRLWARGFAGLAGSRRGFVRVVLGLAFVAAALVLVFSGEVFSSFLSVLLVGGGLLLGVQLLRGKV